MAKRWMLACAAAEGIGMAAAAGAAKVAQALVGEPSGRNEIVLALALVVAGGLVEGVSLGTAQSWSLRATHPRHRRGRYIAMTVVFAGLGWAAASTPAALSGAGTDGSEPSRALVVLGGAGLGLLMGCVLGCVLGAVQAWALAPSVVRPLSWVVGNALAWMPAMAVIFIGATAPDARWTWWQVVVTGAFTGCVAGAVLGFVLGHRVPRLGLR